MKKQTFLLEDLVVGEIVKNDDLNKLLEEANWRIDCYQDSYIARHSKTREILVKDNGIYYIKERVGA